jgi:hydroxybutyrate-dimer hydrolase
MRFPLRGFAMSDDAFFGEVRSTTHRHGDDLLSGGLGLAGLAGAPYPFVQPLQPTAAELRRRAIQSSWKGIADLGPLGGYGYVYGAVPDVPGREYTAFARIAGARQPHRVLLQVPDPFDAKARCLVVTASPGSRGIYGGIALAGAWGLPRGCAVAYTDKGAGSGYFDTAEGSGVALDGTRAQAGVQPLEFEPTGAPRDAGIATRHAHSGDHPEADWGEHVLQAVRFGLAMLDRAFPGQAPFTVANTRIIATGLSNGGGAVLRAAGDDDGMLDGVVAVEPNVHVPGQGRPFYDYATEAALLLPCALTDARFAATPLVTPLPWLARGLSLRAAGLIDGMTPAAQAADALARLHAAGWRDDALASAATSTSFDVWRTVSAAYASAYLRRGVGDMPCGFRYAAAATGPVNAMTRAAWWADAGGVPPGAGVLLTGGIAMNADPTFAGERGLRALWEGDDASSRSLRAAVDATMARLPDERLPVFVVHGAADGLVPTAFSSEPYIRWLRASGRAPVYWKVPHAQHFDAFLSLPGFGEAHAPLLPFAYAALDRLWSHLDAGRALPEDAAVNRATPRGPGPLRAAMLGCR